MFTWTLYRYTGLILCVYISLIVNRRRVLTAVKQCETDIKTACSLTHRCAYRRFAIPFCCGKLATDPAFFGSQIVQSFYWRSAFNSGKIITQLST